MTQEVKRNYLEINSLEDLNQGSKPSDDYSLNLLDPINFQLNKFFYKNIGNKHKWVDRLIWNEEQWIKYVSNENVKTYILKCKNDLVGFFELIHHQEKKEVEIAYLGILEEYQNKKLGSHLLSEAIKISFKNKIHALVIPNGKYTDLDDFILNASSEEMVGLLKGINIVAQKLGISTDVGKGYRALANINEHGGQEVPHLHFHLFGGEKVGKMVE